MRRPYSIRQKFKHLQRKYLADEFAKLTAVHPRNCVHNKEVTIGPDRCVRLCSHGTELFGGDSKRGHVCERIDKATMCPMYQPRVRTMEDAARHLLNETPTEEHRRRKWPDIVILEWVLGDDAHNTREDPGLIAKFFIYLSDMFEGLAVRASRGRLTSKDITRNDKSQNTEDTAGKVD